MSQSVLKVIEGAFMKLLRRALRRTGKAILKLSDRLGRSKEYQKDLPFTYTFGATLLYDILERKPQKVRTVFVNDDDPFEKYHDRAVERAVNLGIPVVHDGEELYARRGNHYSVMAEVDKWEDQLQPGSHVVLVNPTGVGNVGNILRSSLAFGVENVAIISDDFDTFAPWLIRASMGTRLSAHVEVFPTFEDYVRRFPDNKRYAFMLDGASRLAEVEKSAPYTLVFGNETVGLPAEYAESCQPVFIEQSDALDSLNLSNAVGIALYEFSQSCGTVQAG